MDFAAEGFLDGLEGEARAQRLELLEWLAAEGFGAEDLRRSHEDGLLPFLASEREVVGRRSHTARDIERETGFDGDQLVRLLRAQGLPIREDVAHPFTDIDVEAARTARALRDLGFSEDQLLKIARVAGRGLGQLAETMRSLPLESVLEPGLSELEMAQRYRGAVRAVMPLTGPMITQMLRQHLDNMVRTEAIEATERAAGQLPGAREMAVGFADLVGFTRLGDEVPPDELSEVADRLVVIAADVVQPPVRVVKAIGDAVLVVSPEPERLVACSLALLRAVEAEGDAFPQLRVGLATGPVVARGGDVFGHPVNVASRVTGVARAGSVLATREVRDAAKDAFSWSRAGARKLKGLPEPVPLYRARAA